MNLDSPLELPFCFLMISWSQGEDQAILYSPIISSGLIYCFAYEQCKKCKNSKMVPERFQENYFNCWNQKKGSKLLKNSIKIKNYSNPMCFQQCEKLTSHHKKNVKIEVLDISVGIFEVIFPLSWQLLGPLLERFCYN